MVNERSVGFHDVVCQRKSVVSTLPIVKELTTSLVSVKYDKVAAEPAIAISTTANDMAKILFFIDSFLPYYCCD